MALLCLWTPGSCGAPSLHVRSPISGSGLCSSSVHDRDVAFPPLVGLAFGLRAVPLPQADAVGFGVRWSVRLSGLLTGRC